MTLADRCVANAPSAGEVATATAVFPALLSICRRVMRRNISFKSARMLAFGPNHTRAQYHTVGPGTSEFATNVA
jgi:hypothetical protein